MDNSTNTWGDPYNYKGVSLHPIQMKYCDRFYQYVNCLLIEKNKIPDIRIIKMSYLKFLLEISSADEYLIYRNYLRKLLILVFRRKFKFMSNGKDVYIKVGNKLLSESDFDEIRQIISKQNLIMLNDNVLNPEVEKAINEAREFLSKKEQPSTIEENVMSFFAATGYEPEKTKNLTIYIFNKTMQRLNLLKTWEVYAYASLKSGESDKIKHWLSHVSERGLYDDVAMTEDDFNKKTSDSMYQK